MVGEAVECRRFSSGPVFPLGWRWTSKTPSTGVDAFQVTESLPLHVMAGTYFGRVPKYTNLGYLGLLYSESK